MIIKYKNQINSLNIGQSYVDIYDVDMKSSLGSGGAAKVFRCKRKSDGKNLLLSFSMRKIKIKYHDSKMKSK